DEVESIRKFDPATQRSSNPVDEAILLPLTETPVSDDLLGAIHARLSGKRITGAEEIVEQAVRSGGVTVFPGWEFYAPVAGADRTIFDLLPRALVITDEPENLKPEFEHTWSRIEEAHERSGLGNLARAPRLFFSPAAARTILTRLHTSLEKCSPLRWQKPTYQTAWHCPMPISPFSAHVTCLMSPNPWCHARKGKNRKRLHFSPISAIFRSATTLCTWSTESASIRG